MSCGTGLLSSGTAWTMAESGSVPVQRRHMAAATEDGGPRIFVYEMSPELSQDVLEAEYTEGWLLDSQGREYEADIWVYQQMVNSVDRTWDPDTADLFYIPIFPTRLFHQGLGKISWEDSREAATRYVQSALEFVKNKGYWSRLNGQDHFIVITADQGRCFHFSGLSREVWEDIMVIQHLGDMLMRSDDNASFPCYDPSTDILLPAHLPVASTPIHHPRQSPRDISLLYRFSANTHTAVHPYHTHLLRQDLLKHYELDPLNNSDWSVNSIQGTIEDMAKSVFCVCPPGIVAHTSRFWRSIMQGCIPVSFFKAYDLPFRSQIDYSAFSINILPDNLHRLRPILELAMHDGSIVHLQDALHHAHMQLQWDDDGIFRLLNNELGKRSLQLRALRDVKPGKVLLGAPALQASNYANRP